MIHNRIAEILKYETHCGLAYGHNHWSHRHKMEERARETKLHFGDHDMECRDT
jgi:hypothetical protein